METGRWREGEVHASKSTGQSKRVEGHLCDTGMPV